MSEEINVEKQGEKRTVFCPYKQKSVELQECLKCKYLGLFIQCNFYGKESRVNVKTGLCLAGSGEISLERCKNCGSYKGLKILCNYSVEGVSEMPEKQQTIIKEEDRIQQEVAVEAKVPREKVIMHEEMEEKIEKTDRGKQIILPPEREKETTIPPILRMTQLQRRHEYKMEKIIEICQTDKLDTLPLDVWYESYKISAEKIITTIKDAKDIEEFLNLTGELFYHIMAHLYREGNLWAKERIKKEPGREQIQSLLRKTGEAIVKKIKERYVYLNEEVADMVGLLERGGRYSTEKTGLDIEFVNPLYWTCGGYINKYKLKEYTESFEKSKYVYPLDFVLQILESLRKDPQDICGLKS